jgi:ABC-type nitrate/sulfonate/bicarbonate transport system substrate-binding protein
LPATSVGFLPIYAAYHRGFYKDEGIELEIILMSLAAANNAFFKGEIEYSAGLTVWPWPRRETIPRRS